MLTQTIYAHAREMPDKIAVAFDHGRLSYGEFAAAIEASRRSLIAEGILRLEGAMVLAAAAAAYAQLGSGWTWFALLFLVPDLSMLGYFAGPRIGVRTHASRRGREAESRRVTGWGWGQGSGRG